MDSEKYEDMWTDSRREYRKACILNAVAIGANVLAAVVQITRGRWWFVFVHLLVIALVTISFLRYLKSHRELEQSLRRLQELDLL